MVSEHGDSDHGHVSDENNEEAAARIAEETARAAEETARVAEEAAARAASRIVQGVPAGGFGRGSTSAPLAPINLVPAQNAADIPRRNPLGSISQDFTQPMIQGNYSYPTFPIQKVEIVTEDNFHVWKRRLRLASINMRCIKAFESDLEGTPEDAAAQYLLLNSILPCGMVESWTRRVRLKVYCGCVTSMTEEQTPILLMT